MGEKPNKIVKKNLINDNELLYLISENDDEARLMLFEKYLPLIKNKIKQLQLWPSEVDEYYQEGLICLNKAINSYNSHTYQSFNHYFQIILKRRYIDLLRRKKQTEKITYQNDLEEYVSDHMSQHILKETPLNLSNFEQEVYQYRFILEMKPKEIAVKMQCEIRQVYDAIDRIKRKAHKNSPNS